MTSHATLNITLPSRGLLYGKGDVPAIPDGKVSVRKWTVQELSRLEGSGGDAISRMKGVVDECCVLPNAFPPGKLLITDRFAILLAQRCFSLSSSKYLYEFKCQHCGEVNRKVECDIQKDLEDKPAGDGLVEPIAVNLPDAKVEVTLRFLRGDDEDAILTKSKRLKLTSNDDSDPSSTIRLARQIVTIDGTESNMVEKEAFAKRLTAGDLARLRNAVDDVEPGIDTALFPRCRFCKTENEVDFPFNGEFFRPTRL